MRVFIFFPRETLFVFGFQEMKREENEMTKTNEILVCALVCLCGNVTHQRICSSLFSYPFISFFSCLIFFFYFS